MQALAQLRRPFGHTPIQSRDTSQAQVHKIFTWLDSSLIECSSATRPVLRVKLAQKRRVHAMHGGARVAKTH